MPTNIYNPAPTPGGASQGPARPPISNYDAQAAEAEARRAAAQLAAAKNQRALQDFNINPYGGTSNPSMQGLSAASPQPRMTTPTSAPMSPYTPPAVSPTVAQNTSSGYNLQHQQNGIRAEDQDYRLKEMAAQQQQKALQSLTSTFSSWSSQPTTTQSYNLPTVQYQAPAVSGPNTGAADTAGFGAAKARAGSLGRSALDSLKSEMAGRGIMGSGVEGRGIVDRLAAATNPLSDINTQQLHENVGIAQHNQDLANQGAQTQYQGAIAQRGQDLSGIQSSNALAVQQQQQKQQMMIQALQGLQRLF